jgi:chloride channel protein, CIC family
LKKYFNLVLDRIHHWPFRHEHNRTFLIIVSIVVGLVTGAAAIALKFLVHKIQEGLQHILVNPSFNFLLFLFPLIGILLTLAYVKGFRGGKIGRGVESILMSVAKDSSKIEKDKTYSHLITSALTVGFGGSAGLEAPIVVTGAAIGSNTAIDLHMTNKERTLMLACGVAAGISAIFNSPIAGVLFALEVILFEFSIPSFIPLLISSATASVLSNILYKGQLFFLITQGWQLNAVPFYALLGVFMGLISVYVTRMALYTEFYFLKKKSVLKKALGGGIVLGIMIFLAPPLYGEGYLIVENLLNGNHAILLNNSILSDFSNVPILPLLVGIILVFIKVFATSITIGAGGNGGIFAPSLFIGALAGFSFAFGLNMLGFMELEVSNFIVAGMAGALSGVVHAPLTSIFLIAEITGGYALFVPLMIVSAVSFLIARYFEPFSIYSRKLAQKGLLKNDKDRYMLNSLNLVELIEKDYTSLRPEQNLGELVEIIRTSTRNIFPVLNDKGELKGIIILDQVREVMFEQAQYEQVLVKDIMSKVPCELHIHEEMHRVMRKFDVHNVWHLPVTEEKKYLGFVSKTKIFTHYRNLLVSKEEFHFE